LRAAHPGRIAKPFAKAIDQQTMPEKLASDPHAIALEALAWILSDQPRAERFLGLTGLNPDTLRQTAGQASTHRAVLDYLLAHEPDLIAAAEHLQLAPDRLAQARRELV
jgi:hypothetical protein